MHTICSCVKIKTELSYKKINLCQNHGLVALKKQRNIKKEVANSGGTGDLFEQDFVVDKDKKEEPLEPEKPNVEEKPKQETPKEERVIPSENTDVDFNKALDELYEHPSKDDIDDLYHHG